MIDELIKELEQKGIRVNVKRKNYDKDENKKPGKTDNGWKVKPIKNYLKNNK